MRRVLVGWMMLVALLAASMPALGTDAEDVVAELAVRGYFIEVGADVDFEDLEALVARYADTYFVALADDPARGADLFASEALSALGLEGTVVVVSPGELGARSTVHGDADLNDAFDRSIDLFDRSYADGFEAFAASLTPAVVATTEAASTNQPVQSGEPSSGGSGVWIFLLIVAAIVGLIWWAIRRSKRNREQMMDARVEEVKSEIEAQLSEAANDILELEDDVLLSDNEEAKDLYYAGSAAYSEFQERLAGATSLAQLDELAEGADLALWQLESADALIEGRERPPKPPARPEFAPPAATPAPEQRHPELPEDLQLRRDRRSQRSTRPRQRSSGGLGGLGAAAVILRSLQQGRSPRPRTTRRAAQAPRSTGVQMPDFGSSRRTGRSSRRSSPSAGSPKPTLRGRARRRRR